MGVGLWGGDLRRKGMKKKRRREREQEMGGKGSIYTKTGPWPRLDTSVLIRARNSIMPSPTVKRPIRWPRVSAGHPLWPNQVGAPEF